jgi:hypothetical protein
MARGAGSVFYNKAKARWCAQYGRHGRVGYARTEDEAWAKLEELKAEHVSSGNCVICGNPLPLGHWVTCGKPECKRKRNRLPPEAIDCQLRHKWALAAIRSLVQRVGGGDINGLPELWLLITEAEAATASAITGLRERGYSWTEIGAEIGMTKQAVCQWAARHPVDGTQPVTLGGA